jgi:hypothetical protein
MHFYYLLPMFRPVFLLISFLMPVLLAAQEARNTIFAEGAVKGPVYSLNFDHLFHTANGSTLAWSAGFSVERDAISAPLGIDWIKGRHDLHPEFGMLLIPYIDHYKTFLSGDNLSDKYIYVIPYAGYRLQHPDGGLFLKASVGPFLSLDPPSDHFFHMTAKLYGYASFGAGFSF